MTDAELGEFAWKCLGIILDPSWTRTKILHRIMSLAAEVV